MQNKPAHDQDPQRTRAEPDPRSLRTVQLALMASAGFDIPPRIRAVLTIAAIAGLVLVAMASLTGGDIQYIRSDRVIHFVGYSTLAGVFVLALRPVLFVPALLALIGASLAIEFLQGFIGRETDLVDGLANASGVAVGAFLGLTARGIYSYLRGEFATSEVRRNTKTLAPGDVIFKEGEPSGRFYVVKSGLVRLTREGVSDNSNVFGPGEVIGIMGVVQGTPYLATASAVTAAQVFGMDASALIDHADGREQPTTTVLRVLVRRLRTAYAELDNARLANEGGAPTPAERQEIP